MRNSIRFETPENVQVRYEPAGLGTRFVAWFVDQVVVWLLTIALIIALVVGGVSLASILDSVERSDLVQFEQALMYFVGLMVLLWGLGSFLYFGCCELLLRGQTVGKRVSSIRVVKSNGFQLDATSILVRNIFRVLDHLPPMWIVPLVSRLGQRAGDMVAGTIVVSDAPASLSPVRAALGQRTAAEARIRFDHAKLDRLAGADFETIERVLDRLSDMPAEEQEPLLRLLIDRVAKKLQVEPPPVEQHVQFLEDLFSAELRRLDRRLV